MGVVLKAEDVSIRYITGDFKDIGIKEYTVRKLTNNYNVKEFMAVDGVSFELNEGDMLGIIGSNGAGKSTLLKAIAGIMEPTHGKITANGEIAALLELGSGFDGDLTVKENAYLRGAMLGYTREFMDETYDRIIDFAELREFEDRPFKQLSSGMKSRLAFSIASLVDPDILILDEVLSVGDGAFQEKSAKKMREIISKGATTILVSHSLEQIRELCNKVLWLDHGKQIAFGDTQPICDDYEIYLRTGVLPIVESESETLNKDVHKGNNIDTRELSLNNDLDGERFVNFDFARVLAIISVVFCHSVESFYYMYQDRSILWGMLSQESKLFDLVGLTFGRIGVPIFLFLTGSLMLNKAIENGNDCTQFFKKNYIPLLITSWVWIIIWNIFLNLYYTFGGETPPVTMQSVLECLFFQKNVDTIMPAWYLPMIMGVYLFLPFLSVVVKHINFKAIIFPITIYIAILFVLPTLNSILTLSGLAQIENVIIDASFSGGIYGIYIILGYYLSRGLLRNISVKILAILSCLSFGACVAIQFLLAENGVFYNLEYNMLFLLICCSALYSIVIRIPKKMIPLPNIFVSLSRISFFIFFIHNPIQYTIYLTGILSHMPRPVAVISMFLLSFLISIAIGYLVSLIRPLRRILGIK